MTEPSRADDEAEVTAPPSGSASEGEARGPGLASGRPDTQNAPNLTEERDAPVRLAMAFALAASGRPYVERVVQALADPELADQAIAYLVELGHAKPEALVPHLQDRDPVVRARVAIASGLVGSPAAEPELTRLTTDGDPAVRRAAEVAILRLRGARTPPSVR